MKETLVILAAGMGSRYGGLKQIDGVGNHNEPIIEFTIFDAIKAGFKKVVLIIKKEHQEAFEEAIVSKIRPYIEVEYAYQDLKDIPDDVTIPLTVSNLGAPLMHCFAAETSWPMIRSSSATPMTSMAVTPLKKSWTSSTVSTTT